MISLITRVYKSARVAFAVGALGLLAACDPMAMGQGNLPGLVDKSKVQVALLLPKGAPNPGVASIAASAENAARLAVADLGETVEIDLRVYDTAGSKAQSTAVATQAIGEGAKVIIGPLFGENALAVAEVAKPAGISVLALSNNADIAGDNLFILGRTFQTSADRLVKYAFAQGKKRAVIVHAKNISGEAGQQAIEQALAKVGVAPSATQGYDFTPEGVASAMGRVAGSVQSTGADVVLLTASFGDGDLDMIAQLLPERGVNPTTVQYAGITDWNVKPSSYHLPAIQGGWFTMPNPGRNAAFRNRYETTYGTRPHPLAALAYDGIAAVGSSTATGDLSPAQLARRSGYQGATGIFRFLADGTNERGLAIASIQGSEVVILESAPESFAGAGF